jgi:hypothetical protein
MLAAPGAPVKPNSNGGDRDDRDRQVESCAIFNIASAEGFGDMTRSNPGRAGTRATRRQRRNAAAGGHVTFARPVTPPADEPTLNQNFLRHL